MRIPHAILATVDLGSNSFRLQISRLLDDQLYTLDALKETVRLGAGLGRDKVLSEEAQDRALACLARFGERLRGLSPTQVRIVATNTLRIAKNAAAFILRAESLLGFPIEVIAGREEARLIYLGAAHSLPTSRERRLVVDIGGGSTEFIIGSHYRALFTESLALGCIYFSSHYFPNGQLDKASFKMAILAARNEIVRIRHSFSPSQWVVAVGTSGTARSLRDILEINQYTSSDITQEGLEQLKKELIKRRNLQHVNLNGLKIERIPVLPGGLAIMLAIFAELGIERMKVTEGALRDGVLYDLLGRQREHDMREATVAQCTRRYHVDMVQAQRVTQLTERLYRMVMEEVIDAEPLKLLLWSARLHEIGLSIAHTAYHKHSSYILQYADMPGFSRQEQNTVATIVLGHRGELGKIVSFENHPTLWPAMVCLRLAVLFYRSRQDIDLPATLGITLQDKVFCLTLDSHWLAAHPLTAHALTQEIEQWEKVGFTLKVSGHIKAQRPEVRDQKKSSL